MRMGLRLAGFLEAGNPRGIFMKKTLIVTLLLTFAATGAFAQQADPTQTPPKVAKPAPKLTFAERMKQYLIRVGGTVDESKSTADMIVSNSANLRGGKVTIVIVNDQRRNLLGFYVYNFGSLKNSTNKEPVYKYLLESNDSITIGSFFVDSDEDVGYKYLVSAGQTMSQAAFETAYVTMAAVARERKPEIKKLIGGSSEKDEKPPDVKKAGEEKPPSAPDRTASSPQESRRDAAKPFRLEDLVTDPAQSRREDPGVDTATIITEMANIRSEPSDSSEVLLKARKNDLMVLVDRTSVGPWYNVIDVGSSKEGWIHGSVIKIIYTKRKASGSVFEARRLETNVDPTIEITNDSYKDLNLRVGRSLYTISANSKRSIQLVPGSYKYYASAPDMIPAIGEQSFKSGYAYTWRFWIETIVR